jgi:hypothetical protein
MLYRQCLIFRVGVFLHVGLSPCNLIAVITIEQQVVPKVGNELPDYTALHTVTPRSSCRSVITVECEHRREHSTGSHRTQFPIGLLEFFSDILPAALWPLGRHSL